MRQLKIQKSITNRSSEALDKYLVEIGRAPLISIDEEIELAQKIRKGGPEGERAKDKLVTANLRFVVSVAKQYQHQGLTLTDLIDEGNIGLIKAAQKFDETRGFKFISYAVWWIRQSILQAIAEQSRIVRLPLNQVGSLNKISHEINRFEQEFQRHPSVSELSDATNMDEEKIAHDLFLLTSKPVLYVCNVDEGSVKTGNAYVEQVREAIKDENAQLLVIAAKTESEIAELESYEDRQMFLAELGLEESGVNRLVKSAFSLLNLETFITAGPMEVKAWTYRKGWKAPQCAGVIHTDFEKGFIRAEVIKYNDYVELGSEAAVRDAGKLYVEGKDYVVEDGDIMHFRFNV